MTEDRIKQGKFRVASIDKILGVPFKVLDQGFVRVIDYMGGDAAIVQAARVSYGRGTTRVHQDRELIRYLMRHRHMTPFEMCEIKLHVRVPMDIWRQWIRHRTANVNEYSTRYSVAIDEAQRVNSRQWRLQGRLNKQGSEGTIDEKLGRILSEEEADIQKRSRGVYQRRLDAGVAREQARKDLPLSTYTEAYWKIDLRNLFNFLALRLDEHAQLEIRKYAEVIGTRIVSYWCPVAWEAFCDYRLEALMLSRMEAEIIAEISAKKPDQAVILAEKVGWLEKRRGKLKRNLERLEMESKLRRLNLPVPWEKI